MSYVVIVLIFVIIGMSCWLEVKNIEIEQLTSYMMKQENKIHDLEKEIEELKA